MVRILRAFSGSSNALTAETRAPRKLAFDLTSISALANLADYTRFQPRQCVIDLQNEIHVRLETGLGRLGVFGHTFTYRLEAHETLDQDTARAATRERK